MPGDEGKTPPPTTIDGLAAMMTKVLGRLDALDGIKARLTSLESQRAPTSTAPFSYGMPGYGSTSLGSPSFTAAATMATAAFPSFTAPSPVPPQQHCEGLFYWGVDGIQVAAAQLQAAASCWRPVIPAAVALPPLGKKKAFVQEDVCHMSAAVRL